MKTADIIVEDRLRTDLGNIDELANSIREHGLIEPIVISGGLKSPPRLVAGGRRLAALKRLGFTELQHPTHFVFIGELDPIRRKAIELEENIRRKDLSWQEQVRGKQQLLELMQSIHGIPQSGRPKMGVAPGFGINKLAAMLGEQQGQVSEDLQVAQAIKDFPMLAKADTKGSALAQLKILGAVASMSVAASQKSQDPKARSWVLENEDFRNCPTVAPESVDLIWTDLPYGTDISTMSHHAGGVASFDDSLDSALALIPAIAKESYRVLKNDRYACFCFGFTLYTDLVSELEKAGFNVNPVPVIWYKNTKSGENPNTRYSNSYEPILVASKGKPVFIRPGHGNVIQMPTDRDKLNSVQKPSELVREFLLDMCGRGATVVDFCAGTGTTGVAAHQLGMHSILFEKDPSMYALAKARLESM